MVTASSAWVPALSQMKVGLQPRRATAAARLVTPDGSTLEVSVFPNDDFPCINIDLLQKDGSSERVCFVEHNPEKAPGHQLHIGVYCSTEEDTVYYDSYVRTEEKVYEV